MLEQVYEVCFCHELQKAGLAFERQLSVPVVYDGLRFQTGLRLDVLVDGLVICESKAADKHHPVFLAQLLSQLRLTGKRLGYLVNFNVPLIKNGIRRVIL